MPIIFFIALQCLLIAAWSPEAKAEVFTLWPLVDYRHSPAADYSSLHLLGPLIKYERKGEEREFAIRPFYFRAWDPEEEMGRSEYLYPVGSGKTSTGRTSWQGLRLLQYDFGQRELGSDNEFTLFPLIFYGKEPEEASYFAFFPLGGRLLDKFGRDEIRFTLFPLYGQTRKNDTVITNILWPVFATVRGEDESGLKLWPLYGASEKEGVYRKRFFLWPIYFNEDLRLDTASPRHRWALFPFYLHQESPVRVSRTVLWPFFHYRQDLEKGFEQWDMPWPLVRITRGDDKEGGRLLPFYADESTGPFRKRWYLWPLYKIEEFNSEFIERRRDRLLFFLFSRLEETKQAGTPASRKRIDLWPIFSYEKIDGVARLQALSLLEPFFPNNQAIARNWGPLWGLYVRKWDDHGNAATSLLWNLYWRETRGQDTAMEFFPFFSYTREEGRTDLNLLKGIFRFSSGSEGRLIRFFFLPWGIAMGGETTGPEKDGA